MSGCRCAGCSIGDARRSSATACEDALPGAYRWLIGSDESNGTGSYGGSIDRQPDGSRLAMMSLLRVSSAHETSRPRRILAPTAAGEA